MKNDNDLMKEIKKEERRAMGKAAMEGFIDGAMTGIFVNGIIFTTLAFGCILTGHELAIVKKKK